MRFPHEAYAEMIAAEEKANVINRHDATQSAGDKKTVSESAIDDEPESTSVDETDVTDDESLVD